MKSLSVIGVMDLYPITPIKFDQFNKVTGWWHGVTNQNAYKLLCIVVMGYWSKTQIGGSEGPLLYGLTTSLCITYLNKISVFVWTFSLRCHMMELRNSTHPHPLSSEAIFNSWSLDTGRIELSRKVHCPRSEQWILRRKQKYNFTFLYSKWFEYQFK